MHTPVQKRVFLVLYTQDFKNYAQDFSPVTKHRFFCDKVTRKDPIIAGCKKQRFVCDTVTGKCHICHRAINS